MFKRSKLVGGCTLAFSAFALLAAHFINSAVVGAAPGLKVITPSPAARIQPVVVTKITLGNVTVQKGRFAKPRTEPEDPITPFQAGDDWVENLTFYILNRTDKPIVHANFTLTFPEVAPVYRLELGNTPPGFTFNRDTKPFAETPRPTFWFGPKQTMAVHLSDYNDQIRTRVETTARTRVSSLTRMNLLCSGVDFEDGMRFDGPYEAMDPQTHTWRSLGRNYFPGNVDLYWPGQPGWVDPE